MRANNHSSIKIVCVCVSVRVYACDFSEGAIQRCHCDRNFHGFFSFCVIFICAIYTLCYTSNPDTCSSEKWKPSEKSFQILLCSIQTYTLHTNTLKLPHMYRIFICINVCIYFSIWNVHANKHTQTNIYAQRDREKSRRFSLQSVSWLI